MAYDLLTTSGINSLVDAYKTKETENRLSSLQKKKQTYQSISGAYSVISSKITSLKTVLSDLKTSGTSSIFQSKSASSSNTNFILASASSTAAASVYDLRVTQLAKSDQAMSKDITSATANAITGTHSFVIKTGDGSTGEFVSNVDVTFGVSETNQTVMQKIRDAINTDKAVVTSDSFAAVDSYAGGASTIKLNINGTETEVSVTGGGTYEQLIDELVTEITENVSGVTAEKVTDSGNVQLKLTVSNNSNYISISDVSGYALANHLNIVKTQEKSAAGTVNAALFSPATTTSQLSITAKNSGLDYRIKELSDSGIGTALNGLGLNLGTTRPTFSQIDGEDTPGYMNPDITTNGNLLNSKFTFNGLSLQRNSNTVTDVAAGMSFTLKSVMQASDATVSITVAPNSTSMQTQIDSFITKFNELYQYLKTNSSYSSTTRGALTGDSHASALISFMSSTAYSQITGINQDNIRALSQIGITFNSTSGLSITDSTQLTDAITNTPEQVEELFSSTNGIATKLYDYFTPYLNSGGYLDNSITNISTTITRLSDSITSAQERIDKSAESLRSSYQKLQMQLVTLLNMQSNFAAGESYLT